jgi:Zn-dependent protease
VARVGQTQGTKLASESPDSPDENQRQALARGLTSCAALWGLIGVVFVFIDLALLLTVGWPSLFAYACVLVCVVMNRCRIRQSKLVRVASL